MEGPPMSFGHEASPRSHQHVHPLRVYAECFILHVIDELSGEERRKLREFDSATFRWGDTWFEEFAGGFSITVSLVEWIQQQWRNSRESNPELAPAEFARACAQDAFCHLMAFD